MVYLCEGSYNILLHENSKYIHEIVNSIIDQLCAL